MHADIVGIRKINQNRKRKIFGFQFFFFHYSSQNVAARGNNT